MTRGVTVKAIEVAYHRNGVGGEGFHAVTFDSTSDGSKHRMVGVVFPAQYHVAVFDVDELAKLNIAFAHGNSWRGDVYEPHLREAIRAHEVAEEAKHNAHRPMTAADIGSAS